MSIVVNTNIASMNAQRSLMNSSNALQEAMERLSTGQRINSASDDAAGLAISEKLRAKTKIFFPLFDKIDQSFLSQIQSKCVNSITIYIQNIFDIRLLN